jgi:hypothetical protein
MKVFSYLFVLSTALVSTSTAQTQDGSTGDVQAPSSMSLTQFQSVLRTFLDDEMAIVADELSSTGHAFNLQDGAYVTADDDMSKVELEPTIETMLRNRISSIETDANGQRRRMLKNHHHRHRDAKRSKKSKDLPAPHQRGRFADIDPSSIPIEVNATWEALVSHAWDMSKLAASLGNGSKLRGRDSERRSRTSSADSEEYDGSLANLFEDDDELVTDWSEETETLFLVCHSSKEGLDGNDHLETILTAAGKDLNDMDAPESIEVVHSSPLLTCVILSMQPTYAWSIAERFTENDHSFINVCPWVDVMKISPDLFDQILTIDESVIEDKVNMQERGLRNFRRVQANTNEVEEESLFWLEDISDLPSNPMQDKYIVFSLTSPSNMDDAYDVIQSLIDMAKVGQRRRLSSDSHALGMSISEAFSVTGASTRSERKLMSSSVHHWTRLLENGQSDSECISLFEEIQLQPSLVKSSYEFLLIPQQMDTSSYTACVASAIAGIAVNPKVLNIGIVPKRVELHNDKAQWTLQGSVVKTNDSTAWRRPFFEAGLMGQGQIVSVSDTGLDVDNCYFKDGRGAGNIFTKWDTTRRKVIRYDVSPRGGDTKDAYKGHGTHVVGTVTGKHISGTMGDGDDLKEGMAPASKVHFYDIGLG